MSDIKISVETTQVPGLDTEITIIRVDGVIDTMTATELEKVTNSLINQKRYNIIVDLGGVDYISSAGWGIFISNIREIRLNKGDIKLARMIPNVYEIFELLEFDSILKAFDNIEKAKNDFSGSPVAIQPKADIVKPQPVTVVEASTSKAGATVLQSGKKPSISMARVEGLEFRDGGRQTSATARVELEKQKSDSAEPLLQPGAHDLGEAIMDVVGKDPFLSIGEIKQAISTDFPGTGFLKTWWTLKKLGLSSKKKRFYFARTRRFAK
jgi:anti-sigma B factor antagonist